MKNQHLTQALRERGVAQVQIRELFLYYLNSEDRQLTMLEWLESDPEADERAIFKKAQEILEGFLAKNADNVGAEDMPLPKWTAPVETEASTVVPALPAEEKSKQQSDQSEEYFDKVLQAFFHWE